MTGLLPHRTVRATLVALLLAGGLCAASGSTLARKAPAIDVAKFQSRALAAAKRFEASPGTGASLKVGEVTFADIASLRPTQNRVSFLTAAEKLRKAGNPAAPPHDGGRALYDTSAAKPAVLGPDGGVYIIDGHHGLIASLAAGAKTYPVEVVADYSAMPAKTFWKRMEKEGWAYTPNLKGKRQIPSAFSKLQDDPNRYLATALSRKLKAKADGTVKSSGHKYPVWVKTRFAPSFIEFHVADALYAAGIRYDNAMGLKPSKDVVEKSRAAVVSARKSASGALLSRVVVFKSRKAWDDGRIPKVLRKTEKLQGKLTLKRAPGKKKPPARARPRPVAR